MASTPVYRRGEVVWAKIKGYPWWPAKVSRVVETREKVQRMLLVNFVGENTHAKLPLAKIAKFAEKLAEAKQSKNQKLLESIAEAQEMYTKSNPKEREESVGGRTTSRNIRRRGDNCDRQAKGSQSGERQLRSRTIRSILVKRKTSKRNSGAKSAEVVELPRKKVAKEEEEDRTPVKQKGGRRGMDTRIYEDNLLRSLHSFNEAMQENQEKDERSRVVSELEKQMDLMNEILAQTPVTALINHKFGGILSVLSRHIQVNFKIVGEYPQFEKLVEESIGKIRQRVEEELFDTTEIKQWLTTGKRPHDTPTVSQQRTETSQRSEPVRSSSRNTKLRKSLTGTLIQSYKEPEPPSDPAKRDLNLAFEACAGNAPNLSLRKKVCKKFAAEFEKWSDGKTEEVRDLALRVEGQIRKAFPDMQEGYRTTVKRLLWLVKRSRILTRSDFWPLEKVDVLKLLEEPRLKEELEEIEKMKPVACLDDDESKSCLFSSTGNLFASEERAWRSEDTESK
eukprot:TRINITY_DN5894_c0_g1_i1.p1 TRINITY_DN5894_c0_g1~~TRINITY_DN5894_c0_g1_i1.p1  ORF type:complete len:507 (+),score=92.96 TRINITY_DN5894_c0_g1_i1:19-1539(+)